MAIAVTASCGGGGGGGDGGGGRGGGPTGRGSWVPTDTTGAPSARAAHSSAWTGSVMIVWGGTDGTTAFNTGGVYDPALDSWAATDTTDPDTPSARADHRAVFAGGTGMIVWGGTPDGSTGLNTGAIYHPDTNRWSPITTANAPSPRAGHRMEWTDTELIVWGGTPDYSTCSLCGDIGDIWMRRRLVEACKST